MKNRDLLLFLHGRITFTLSAPKPILREEVELCFDSEDR